MYRSQDMTIEENSGTANFTTSTKNEIICVVQNDLYE